MYLEVYIDVIFIINYIMDLLLLFIVKTILKITTSKIRLLSGALIGAISSCILAIIPWLNGFIQFLLSYLVIAYFMIFICFGKSKNKTRMKAFCLLYISTFFLGGTLNSLYYTLGFGNFFKELLNGGLLANRTTIFYIVSIIAAILAVYVFVNVLMTMRSGELELYETELYFKDQRIRLVGLMDTGNSLYDPILRKPVLIAEYNVLKPLFSTSEIKYLNGILKVFDKNFDRSESKEDSNLTDSEEDDVKIRMIPYHSIGKSGMLPAVEMNQVIIWDREEKIKNEKVLVAVSGTRISKHDEYQIILHRDVM